MHYKKFSGNIIHLDIQALCSVYAICFQWVFITNSNSGIYQTWNRYRKPTGGKLAQIHRLKKVISIQFYLEFPSDSCSG